MRSTTSDSVSRGEIGTKTAPARGTEESDGCAGVVRRQDGHPVPGGDAGGTQPTRCTPDLVVELAVPADTVGSVQERPFRGRLCRGRQPVPVHVTNVPPLPLTLQRRARSI